MLVKGYTQPPWYICSNVWFMHTSQRRWWIWASKHFDQNFHHFHWRLRKFRVKLLSFSTTTENIRSVGVYVQLQCTSFRLPWKQNQLVPWFCYIEATVSLHRDKKQQFFSTTIW